MNSLVRTALGVGDGPWPPDYYALLGLTPAEATPERVESAVLERMERLRAYQLAQPEPVTEAMNLLARALDTLGDPAARRRYDAAQSPAEPPPTLVPATPIVSYSLAPEVTKPVPAARPMPTPRPIVVRPAHGDPLLRQQARRLVATRHLLDAWDGAGPYLAMPSYKPPTRFAAVEILIHLRRIAELVTDEFSNGSGELVVALAQSSPMSQTLLEMSDARRELLADDWRAGRWVILESLEQARASMGRPGQSWRRRVRRWRGQLPQAIAGVLGIAAMALAVYRWLA